MQAELSPHAAPLSDADLWVERRAKLFEAGDFPEKALQVTAEDLARLAAQFDSPVPVLIEHRESPLRLGFLTAVEAHDRELFGTLSLRPEANELIENSGARSLSIGLSPDLRRIQEVSLVRHPRVSDARLFRADSQIQCVVPFDDAVDWSAAYRSLVERVREQEIGRQIEAWSQAGKLTPREVEPIQALLSVREPVTFGGESVAVSEVIRRWIEARPSHAFFRELNLPFTPERSALSAEAEAFYREHFPDLDPQLILKEGAHGRID